MKNILFILSLLTGICWRINSGPVQMNSMLSEIEVTVNAPLTMQNVINELKDNDVQHIDIVLRQVIWETGYLKSKRAVKDHNLFGFQTGKGGIKFDKWQDSVKYYKKWQDRKYKGGDYYIFLNKVGYAEDTSYTDKLQTLSTKKFKNLYT